MSLVRIQFPLLKKILKRIKLLKNISSLSVEDEGEYHIIDLLNTSRRSNGALIKHILIKNDDSKELFNFYWNYYKNKIHYSLEEAIKKRDSSFIKKRESYFFEETFHLKCKSFPLTDKEGNKKVLLVSSTSYKNIYKFLIIDYELNRCEPKGYGFLDLFSLRYCGKELTCFSEEMIKFVIWGETNLFAKNFYDLII